MRFRPASRAVLAGASLFATSIVPATASRADILVGSTLIPTSSVVTSSSYVPTSYVTSSYIPTSYVSSSIFPTSTILPTSTVYPSSTIIESGPSVYYPTSYVETYRRGLFRPRRYVERTNYYATPLTPTSYYSPTGYLSSSYIPTTYVVPTVASSAVLPTTLLSGSYVTPTSIVYDSGVVTTAATVASPCYDSIPAPPVQTRAVAPSRPAQAGPGEVTSTPTYANPPASTRSTDRQPTAVNSVPGAEPPAAPGDVSAGVANVPPPKVQPNAGGIDSGPATASPPSPRPAEAPIPDPGTIGGDPKLGYNETIRRSALRPAYSSSRNVLRGRVISRDSRTPEEGVPVVLTSPSGASLDLTTYTDAEGEFKISLPTGEWNVKVAMASGKVSEVVRAVTAGGGKVYDADNTAVGELLIKR